MLHVCQPRATADVGNSNLPPLAAVGPHRRKRIRDNEGEEDRDNKEETEYPASPRAKKGVKRKIDRDVAADVKAPPKVRAS